MAPKKKGKANKLAKMSDEERARYLQHRADIEEEARRRKQELIARFMKNKLNKEEVFSRINLAKINQNWRFILRKLKVKEMEQELQTMIASFARTVDSKNAVILRLMTSLEEAEDQYSRMLQSHMEMISHFLSISSNRLKFFHDNFEQQKDILIEHWEDELQSIEFNHKESENNLQLIIFQQDENMKKYMEESTTSKAHLANSARVELEQEMNGMKANKQLQLEDIWNEMKSVFINYVNYHNPKIQQYQSLRQKDLAFRKEITQHMDRILIASDIISHYQNEWENMSEELELSARNSKQKRDSINIAYSRAKMNITERHSDDKEQLTSLSVESSNALKRLDALLLKVNKITQMETTCKKYETDSEKVLPWNSADFSTSRMKTSIPTDLAEEIETLDLLENFWFKVNRVTVHAATLKAECDSLKQENEYLKECLKNFLMEAALGDIKGSSTEISGRPASMRMYRIVPNVSGMCDPVMRRPVTCIEGSICNAIQYEQRALKWKSMEREAQKIVVRRFRP